MRAILTLITVIIMMLNSSAIADDNAKNTPNYARESSGLISSDLQGAFPKSLWKSQPRSEVQFLLENMPANSSDKAIQKLKREFLISQADTRLIKNDIQKEQYKDIFIIKLKKLMELGRYNDAFKLYTNEIETPETSELAETGILLTLDEKGIPTTCLDVKVLSPNFEQNSFWNNINTICDLESGIPHKEFDKSTILEGIYSDKDFFLPAQYIDRFSTFSQLELHILFKKGRVKYDNLQKEQIESAPPQITRFFQRDGNFPERLQKSLQEHAFKQNIDEINKKESKTIQENTKDNVVFNESTATQQETEFKLKESLISNTPLTEGLEKRLYVLAAKNPQNYVYIQIFSLLGLTNKKYEVPEDKWLAGIGYFTEKDAEKVNFLKTTLDKQGKFSNNLVSVYEKHLVLSEDGQYQLPKDEKLGEINQNLWSGWQKDAEIQNYIGLSFLIALHSDSNGLDKDQYQTQRNVLSSLSTVGLIEKTHQLGRKMFANMMGTK